MSAGNSLGSVPVPVSGEKASSTREEKEREARLKEEEEEEDDEELRCEEAKVDQ